MNIVQSIVIVVPWCLWLAYWIATSNTVKATSRKETQRSRTLQALLSMLPPQNAAGNWIKVVQRVPVVISIDPAELAAHPLRIGLSMRVSLDTHERSGHLLDGGAPLPTLGTRVQDGVASEADAAAAQVIRDNLVG